MRVEQINIATDFSSHQLDGLARRKQFSTFDQAQGYHLMPMHPDSRELAAFITPDYSL